MLGKFVLGMFIILFAFNSFYCVVSMSDVDFIDSYDFNINELNLDVEFDYDSVSGEFSFNIIDNSDLLNVDILFFVDGEFIFDEQISHQNDDTVIFESKLCSGNYSAEVFIYNSNDELIYKNDDFSFIVGGADCKVGVSDYYFDDMLFVELNYSFDVNSFDNTVGYLSVGDDIIFGEFDSNTGYFVFELSDVNVGDDFIVFEFVMIDDLNYLVDEILDIDIEDIVQVISSEILSDYLMLKLEVNFEVVDESEIGVYLYDEFGEFMFSDTNKYSLNAGLNSIDFLINKSEFVDFEGMIEVKMVCIDDACFDVDFESEYFSYDDFKEIVVDADVGDNSDSSSKKYGGGGSSFGGAIANFVTDIFGDDNESEVVGDDAEGLVAIDILEEGEGVVPSESNLVLNNFEKPVERVKQNEITGFVVENNNISDLISFTKLGLLALFFGLIIGVVVIYKKRNA